jgi:hypothetical protein
VFYSSPEAKKPSPPLRKNQSLIFNNKGNTKNTITKLYIQFYPWALPPDHKDYEKKIFESGEKDPTKYLL